MKQRIKKGSLKFTKKGVKYYYKTNKAIYVDRVLLLILIMLASIGFMIKGIICTLTHNHKVEQNVVVLNESKEQQMVYTKDNQQETSTTEVKEEQPVIQEPTKLDYRMTYYHPNDSTGSGNTTASGKSTKDFTLNENGWYTYNGKLVVATANSSLRSWDRYKNSTQPTYSLYDELVLEINGISYDAIVLDKCGACMNSAKIDLYVKDSAHGLDTTIKVIK